MPQYFGTDPIDQGGTRHGGSGVWISRTFAFVWSELENPCELQLVIRALPAGGVRELSNAGDSVGCWSNIILSPRKTGFFSRGARHVTSTSRHSGDRHVKSCPLTGTCTTHVTSLPTDRGSTHHVVTVYQGTMSSLWRSVGKFLPSPIPPGVSGCDGYHGDSD